MFSMKLETKTLVSLMLAKLDYELLTYKDLSAAIGMDVRRGPGYAYLSSAMRHILSDKQIVFEVVRGQGVRRAKPDEIVDNGGAAIRRMNRHARRSVRKISALSQEEYESLPNDKRIKHNVRISILGAVAACSTEKAELRVEAATKSAPLPPAKMFELFAPEKGGAA